MANERNVIALKQLIREWSHTAQSVDLPEWMASQGVLVPSALTNDQAVEIGADAVGAMPIDPAEVALYVQEGPERIARGS